MRKEIRHAYDHLHVSDEMTERLKRELYRKDFHEEDEITEVFHVEEAPRFQFGKHLGFMAAAVMLGVCVGVSMWNMLESRNDAVFNPQATVPVEVTSPAYDAGYASGTVTEETETTEEPALLKEYYHNQERTDLYSD